MGNSFVCQRRYSLQVDKNQFSIDGLVLGVINRCFVILIIYGCRPPRKLFLSPFEFPLPPGKNFKFLPPLCNELKHHYCPMPTKIFFLYLIYATKTTCNIAMSNIEQ